MIKPIKGSAQQPATEVTDKKNHRSVPANTDQTSDSKDANKKNEK